MSNTRNKPHIIRNVIKCPDGTILTSRHVHDYQSHFCTVTNDRYFVDGGYAYLRRSTNEVPAEDLTVTTDDLFEVQRKVFTWKSYGKNLEHLPYGILVPLSEMTNEHIGTILESQTHIKGTYVEELMKNELEYRQVNGINIKE